MHTAGLTLILSYSGLILVGAEGGWRRSEEEESFPFQNADS